MSFDIPSLESEELLCWARLAEAHSQEVKKISSQYNIDLPKHSLGDVLSTIIGDDEYCFGLRDTPFNQEYAQAGKEALLIRLNWEIGLEETPEEIRQRLIRFLPAVEETEWRNEESFLMIKQAWFKNIKKFVQYQIETNKSYREAIAYEFEMELIVHPEYREFLLGKVIR